mmetsp:Transcript_6713/g.8369  ORF Transcript_6713/g.8369 Transcript_6713/m.8369 type:complete len:448 (-) Transcript_6713:374-1717(-)
MIVEKSVDEIPKEWNRSFLLYTSPDIIEENRQALERLDDCVIFKHIPGEQSLDWENSASELADNLIFWFPRSISDEELATWSLAFSAHISSGKVIYGREKLNEEDEDGQPTDPEIDVALRTLVTQAKGEQVPEHSSFEDCIKSFEEKTKGAELRKEGERYVPFHVWKHAAFQNWYKNLIADGSRLEKARYAYDFRVGPGKKFLLYWTIYADIYIAAENRNVNREVVLGRTDIKCIFPYFIPKGDDVSPLDCDVVLIKEFRSPAVTDDCFIYELPGGSAFKPIEPLVQAANELKEEAGVEVEDFNRIHMHNPRQLASKTSVHQAYLFSIALTKEEIQSCRKRAEEKVALGNAAETEQTYVLVMKLGQALRNNLIDWSMLGMMYSVLAEALEDRHPTLKGKLNKTAEGQKSSLRIGDLKGTNYHSHRDNTLSTNSSIVGRCAKEYCVIS